MMAPRPFHFPLALMLDPGKWTACARELVQKPRAVSPPGPRARGAGGDG
jgi:hypothetical protein